LGSVRRLKNFDKTTTLSFWEKSGDVYTEFKVTVNGREEELIISHRYRERIDIFRRMATDSSYCQEVCEAVSSLADNLRKAVKAAKARKQKPNASNHIISSINDYAYKLMMVPEDPEFPYHISIPEIEWDEPPCENETNSTGCVHNSQVEAVCRHLLEKYFYDDCCDGECEY
ncbi:MAG: hypothetical protein ACI4RP_07640, partial [Acutalibacteraceae bacterium]